MHRRSLLLGVAAAVAAPLARPAIAANAKTLSIVPQIALNSIDPAAQTRLEREYLLRSFETRRSFHSAAIGRAQPGATMSSAS